MPADPGSGPLTLALDASTYTGSVAVLRGRVVLSEREVAMRGEREERLMPAVAEALRTAGVRVADVERVVCGAGPGSFTSLRIAASIAKGVAQGANVALAAVSSLTLIVAGGVPTLQPGLYLAALDAMRGERYAAFVELSAERVVLERSAPALVHAASLSDLASSEKATLVGPEWPAPGPGASLRPRAAGVAALGGDAALRSVDLATWEPDYGRLAEAQVKWEAAHGRSLSDSAR